MQETVQKSDIAAPEHGEGFNYNKLQAVICIASSAAVSIALIVWAAKTFF